MPLLKLDVDNTTYESLVALALRELRPIPWQAEKVLRDCMDRERRKNNGKRALATTAHENDTSQG